MIRVEERILIRRGIEAVFAFLTDHRNDVRWQEGLLEVRVVPDGASGVGTQITAVRKFLGRRAESVIEIDELIPGRKESFRSIAGPLRMSGCLLFEPEDGSTRVTQQMEMHTLGFFGLADVTVTASLRRNLATGLNDVRELLEGSSAAHSS